MRHRRYILANGIAISLLLALGCPFLGTRAFLLLRKQAIRKEVKARILAGVDKNELVQLVFSKTQTKTELRWHHSKEFEYRGEMYDIVEAETRGDSVFYHCIHDRAETAVNQQLAALTARAANADPPSQNCIQQFFDFLKHLLLPPPCDGATFGPGQLALVHFFLPKKQDCPFAPPSPPPKVFSSMI